MSEISQCLNQVRERIQRAAEDAGRNASQVQLLAVSKTHPSEAIREAYAAGQRDFGENYLQELDQKARELADLPELRWHVIGHVQTNKAKLAVQHASMVHSVDSVRLAEALGKRYQTVDQAPNSARLKVLVEVNVGREAQKAGCAVDALSEVLEAIEGQPSLQLCGLMTIPPLELSAEAARPYFAELRSLRDQHGGSQRLPELSMGMSHDLEAAIAEGASIVRVGTAIFGARPVRLASAP